MVLSYTGATRSRVLSVRAARGSDGKAEETRRRDEVRVIGHDRLGHPDRLQGSPFEDGPQAERIVEAAAVDDPYVAVFMGPAGDGLGEASLRAQQGGDLYTGRCYTDIAPFSGRLCICGVVILSPSPIFPRPNSATS